MREIIKLIIISWSLIISIKIFIIKKNLTIKYKNLRVKLNLWIKKRHYTFFKKLRRKSKRSSKIKIEIRKWIKGNIYKKV